MVEALALAWSAADGLLTLAVVSHDIGYRD